jgi:hypothetical protein
MNIQYKYGKQVCAELDGKEVVLYVGPDEYPDNPRKAWDNLGTMVCWHRRYTLGDVQPKYRPDEFWRELAIENDPTAAERIEYWEYSERRDAENQVDRIISAGIRGAVVLPLYLYDHSGLAISTRPWMGRAQHARWDSGQVGYIYVTRARILECFCRQRLTRALGERAKEGLQAEVEEYNDYLSGNAHYVSVEVIEYYQKEDGGLRTRRAFEEHVTTLGDLDYLLPEVNAELQPWNIQIVR